MKAIIMAGGEGKRLRPITENIPKPLLPVANVPVIKRILKLLSDNGVDEALITVGYLADSITDAVGDECCGVKIRYLREKTPLGTAGGIKAGRDFVGNEPFAVMSGDALSEADLKAAFKMREEKDALVLMLLSRQSDPGEYGVVLLSDGGRIKTFSEKPSVSSTFTDTVNSGIYIMSPEIFDYIPDGKSDFGADIFPKLLKENKKLYGKIDESYWCDIGDIHSFRMANLYMNGKGNCIGKDCFIPKDTALGTVFLDRVRVGQNTKIENSVICSDTVIGRDCVIGENTVIGHSCNIGNGAVICDGTVLKPYTVVPEDAFIRNGSVITKYELSTMLDGNGISAPSSIMTPSFCIKLGSAFCQTVKYGRIGLMSDGSKDGLRVLSGILRGIGLKNGESVILGDGFESAASYAAVNMLLDLSLFIKEKEGKISIAFFDHNGLYPKRNFERELMSCLICPDDRSSSDNARISSCDFVKDYYYLMLKRSRCVLDGYRFRIIRENMPSDLLKEALLSMGGREDESGIKLCVSDDGFNISVEEDGVVYDDWHNKAVILKYLIWDDISLPVTAPTVFQDICRGRVMLFSHCPMGETEDEARNGAQRHPELIHGCVCGMELLGLMSATGRKMKELISKIPPFATAYHSVNVKDKNRFTILPIMGSPDGDGIVCQYYGGNVRVVPDHNGYKIYSEAASGEYASELISLSEKEIKKLLSEQKE